MKTQWLYFGFVSIILLFSSCRKQPSNQWQVESPDGKVLVNILLNDSLQSVYYDVNL